MLPTPGPVLIHAFLKLTSCNSQAHAGSKGSCVKGAGRQLRSPNTSFSSWLRTITNYLCKREPWSCGGATTDENEPTRENIVLSFTMIVKCRKQCIFGCKCPVSHEQEQTWILYILSFQSINSQPVSSPMLTTLKSLTSILYEYNLCLFWAMLKFEACL